MLTTPVLHPPLLAALAGAGHGSQILIADGNYPVSTGARISATRIHLNVRPGLLSSKQVLEAVLAVIPVEAVHVMAPDSGPEPSIFTMFREVLPPQLSLRLLPRGDFYDAAHGTSLAVVVATGEQQLFGNLLLTVGVVSSTPAT
jgi:L-fucose mutarotase